MTEDEFAAWWSEHRTQGDVFIDVLRRHLAAQLQLNNSRQLALVCDDEMLSSDSPWIDAELMAVIRPLADPDGPISRTVNGDVVRLLERPLDPDTQVVDTYDKPSTLQMAASKGHLAASADVKADRDGLAALHLAAGGHTEVVQQLLQAGAHRDQDTVDGFTSMHLASKNGHEKVVCCLLQAGAANDTGDIFNQTPLHLAARNGQLKVVCVSCWKLVLTETRLTCSEARP